MEYFSVRLVLLLVVAVVATVITFRLALKQETIGRKHVVASSALCLLGLLGLIPAVRDRISTIQYPGGDVMGYGLVLTVLVSGVLVGAVLIGRKRLVGIARDVVNRIRLAFEERRDPELKRRNVCIRRYERVLQVLNADTPTEGDGARPWRHDEMVQSVIRDLTDEDIEVLSAFLCFHMLGGKSPSDVFVFFLKGERRCAARDDHGMRSHLVRLTVVAGRIQREHAAA